MEGEEAAIVKNGEVEVTSEEEGFKGAWYKAVLQDSPSKSGQKMLTVRYLTLLNDDGLSPLTETIDQSFIRPVPPENLYNDVVFEEGVLVDADYKDGWWMGVVLKRFEEDEKFLVYFDSPPDVIEFEKKQLRVHLDWNGWKWFQPEITELDKSEFSSGTMIEVSSIIEKGEIIWFPAIVIKQIGKEKKFIVKDINKHLSYNGEETRPNVTIDSRRVRPKPPLVEEEEFELMECVEVFHCSIWRQGLIKGVLSEKRYLISLGATREEYEFQHSDLRPVMVWEDNVWHNNPKRNTGKKKATRSSSSNAKPIKTAKIASIAPVTPSLVITATPLKEAETEGKKSPEKNQNGLGSNSTRKTMLEEEIHEEEDTNRKRKREQEQEDNNSKTDVEVIPQGKEIPVLPFEKKSPYWKKCESSKVFKSSPQAPHFNPLLEMKEESIREWSAVGMMVSFYDLLEEVQELKLDDSVERLNNLIESFAEYEKHGFDIAMAQSRIKKVLALKDERAKKAEERKCVEEKIEEGEIEMRKVEEELVEIEREMLELKRREAVAKEKKEGVEREISEMKLNVGKIVEEIEDVEVEVKRIVSASW